MRAAIGLVALLISFTASSHEGEPGEGAPYVPPPVVEPPANAYTNVGAQFAHEVWLVDQSNSAGKTYGGTIAIFDGKALRVDAANAPREIIDLGSATADKCFAATGANPVRPHMLVFNLANTHAALSFVASGHVAFFDARTRARALPWRASARSRARAARGKPTPSGPHLTTATSSSRIRTARNSSGFAPTGRSTRIRRNPRPPSTSRAA